MNLPEPPQALAPSPEPPATAPPTVSAPEQNKYAWVTQPLLLAAATALAYYYAYQFEVGYCSHFQIPNELIKIDAVRIAITVAAMVFVGWGVSFVFGLYSKEVFEKGQKWWKRLLYGLPLLVIAYLIYRFQYQWVSVLSYGFFLTGVVRSDISNKKPLHRTRFMSYVHDFLAERAGFWAVRFAVYCYFGAVIVNLTGAAMAEGQTRFLVPIGNPNMVVLKIYGDTLICAKADLTKHEIYPIFFFYSVNSDFSKGLESHRMKKMEMVELPKAE